MLFIYVWFVSCTLKPGVYKILTIDNLELSTYKEDKIRLASEEEIQKENSELQSKITLNRYLDLYTMDIDDWGSICTKETDPGIVNCFDRPATKWKFVQFNDLYIIKNGDFCLTSGLNIRKGFKYVISQRCTGKDSQRFQVKMIDEIKYNDPGELLHELDPICFD